MRSRFQIRLLAAQPDGRLIALVREGNDRAFEAIVLRYRHELLRHCRRLQLSESLVEEALQQAFLNAWVALRRGAEVRELRPWLYRIVHNVAIDAMRREQHLELGLREDVRASRESHASDETPASTARQVPYVASAAPPVEETLALRGTLAGVAQLPDMQREVLVRTAIAGDSHEQVARALGISDGAVRGLLYRARARLRTTVAALTPPPLVAGAAGVAGLSVKGGIAALTVIAATVAGVALKSKHADVHAQSHSAPPHAAQIVPPAHAASSRIAPYGSAASREVVPYRLGATRQSIWHEQAASRQIVRHRKAASREVVGHRLAVSREIVGHRLAVSREVVPHRLAASRKIESWPLAGSRGIAPHPPSGPLRGRLRQRLAADIQGPSSEDVSHSSGVGPHAWHSSGLHGAGTPRSDWRGNVWSHGNRSSFNGDETRGREAHGDDSQDAALQGAAPQGAQRQGTASQGAAPWGDESQDAASHGATPQDAASQRPAPQGPESQGVESRDAAPQDASLQGVGRERAESRRSLTGARVACGGCSAAAAESQGEQGGGH